MRGRLVREGNLITVGVIDDHLVARAGVERLFEADSEVRVVRSAASLEEFEAGAMTPDVVILDLYLTGREPDLDVVATIARRSRVLVCSASGLGKDVLAAIEAGASGYITKQASEASFVAAVRAVASGDFYLSSQLADVMHTEAKRRAQQQSAPGLSPREEEALRLIAEGFTHAQAARRMHVRQSTFDTYIKRVRDKLGLGNKADLTRKAIELGLSRDEHEPDPPW